MANNRKTVETLDKYFKIRKIPVDQLKWRPTACAVVIKDSKILLVQERGMYHLPGGGVNIGEDPSEAVIRETKEETGIDVASPKLIETKSSFYSFINTFGDNELYHYHALNLFYKCKFSKGKINSATKLDDYEKSINLRAVWLPVEDLKSIKVGTTYDWRPIIDRHTN